LTTINRQELAHQDLPVQFATYLSKPVRQSQFYSSLLNLIDQRVLPSQPLSNLSIEIDREMATRLPLKILVAEDNIVNQKVLSRLLQRLGYQGDMVNNGLEVLDALSHQIYDVVLMDVQMPEMDGLTTTQQIRERWLPENRPYIIAVTANAMNGDREECLQMGMDDYLSKPIRIEKLVQVLNRCSERLSQFAHHPSSWTASLSSSSSEANSGKNSPS